MKVEDTIAEVRRLDKAAFHAPWALCEDEDDPDYPYRFYVAAGQGAICDDMEEGDAALIAYYRTVTPLLAEALEVAVGALLGIVGDETYNEIYDRGAPADAVQDDFERCEDALAHIQAMLEGNFK